MSYSGNVRTKGSVRITAGNIILAGTNSGLFVDPILNNGAGDNTISIDPDNPNSLAPSDTVGFTAEGVIFGSGTIERVDENTIRVRTFDAAGVALDMGYALVANTVFN
ncbi:hypothetical protein LCGC14_1022870 [marine sediment metagenome]|uniref:Uncharacterized protein n=1 Tax=marine sediment metagenome TaxID=412755 RepID=A0A0F9R2W2_9ZZZZ